VWFFLLSLSFRTSLETPRSHGPSEFPIMRGYVVGSVNASISYLPPVALEPHAGAPPIFCADKDLTLLWSARSFQSFLFSALRRYKA